MIDKSIATLKFCGKGRRTFKISLYSIYVTMSVFPTPVVSPSVLVSLAATPWLLTIVSLKAASGFLEQLGLASEEVFRGDRLPVLHFPAENTSSSAHPPD
jgi:hypothetical protein